MRFFNFIFGLAVGVAAGMLLAPDSGKRNRAIIKDKATKYSHDTVDFVDKKSRHLANKVKGYAHEIKGAVSGAVHRGEEMVEEEESPTM